MVVTTHKLNDAEGITPLTGGICVTEARPWIATQAGSDPPSLELPGVPCSRVVLIAANDACPVRTFDVTSSPCSSKKLQSRRRLAGSMLDLKRGSIRAQAARQMLQLLGTHDTISHNR